MLAFETRKTRRQGDMETRRDSPGCLSLSPCLPVSLSPCPRISASPRRRSAFTLVEMLIVVSILMIITVAVVAVAPRFTDDRKLSRAADGLAQWLLTAKQRSYRDQIPTGVRLFPDPQHNGLITELQYIQQPDDFKGGGITLGPSVIPGINGGLPVFVATGYGGVDFTGGFADQTLWPVQGYVAPQPGVTAGRPGDFLEVKGTGLVHLIVGVSPTVLILATPNGYGSVNPGANTATITLTDSTGTGPGNANQLQVGMFVNSPGWATMLNQVQITAINTTTVPPSITVQTPGPLPAGAAALSFIPAPSTWVPGSLTGTQPPGGVGATAEYRIIRQPRVLTGETPLQLPAGICIDPNPKLAGDTNGFGVPADIMFSPQGGVVNSGGRDSIILWVRDYTKDLGPQLLPNQPPNTYPISAWPPGGQPGEQFLILIQTHTGFIAQHPIDTTAGGDPYSFTKDARSSGL